jgi:predicted transcriptional regulator of viral defense system
MDSLITKIYQSNKTIFTTKDLALLWGELNANNLKSKTSYYVKQGDVKRVTRGVYAKTTGFEPKELATSIYTPAYISFETVLREHGVIFQHLENIFVATKLSKLMKLEDHTFVFRKLKDIVLYNQTGIVRGDSYDIASLERAFLDTIYLSVDFYFDNLRPINWEICGEMVKIYNNKSLEARLEQYRKNNVK